MKLIAAPSTAIRTDYAKATIGNTLKNSKFRLFGDK